MLGLKFDLPTITLLPIAIVLDLATIIITFLALDDWGVCEIIGLLFIDVPLVILGMGSMGGKKQMTNKMVKLLRGPLGAISTLFIELIPAIDWLPMWTIYTYICVADPAEIPIIGGLSQGEQAAETDEAYWKELSRQAIRENLSDNTPVD